SAAQDRDWTAAGGDRDIDGAGDAVRRLLGLCRADRGPDRPEQGRIRWADEGCRHWWPGAAVRRGNDADRTDRARSDPRRSVYAGRAQPGPDHAQGTDPADRDRVAGRAPPGYRG